MDLFYSLVSCEGREVRILLACAILIGCNCISTFRTARGTPPDHGSHTLGAELQDFDYPSVQYQYRRGFTRRLELGGGLNACGTMVQVGGKYGLFDWWAMDFNARMLLTSGPDGGMLPGFDLATIFGNDNLYFGVKCVKPGAWESRDRFFLFFGCRIKVNNSFSLIPELSLGTTETVVVPGLGLSFESGF